MKRKLLYRTVLLLVLLAASLPLTSVSAHPLSVSYTSINVNDKDTTLTFSLDVLSIIEQVKGIDADGDYKITADELKAKESTVSHFFEDSLLFELDSKTIEASYVGSAFEKKADKDVITFTFTMPHLEPGQSLKYEDDLYSGDENTNYADFVSMHFYDQSSESVLRGKDRSFTLLVTENQDQQQQDGSAATQSQSPTSTQPSSDNSSASADAAPQHEQVTVTTSQPSSFVTFFKLGMNHILTGYDHLLFLLALLLSRQTWKQYAGVITAFTVAHSITLTLATLGLIHLPSRWVESVIALSICYVALENIFRKKIRYRWPITFLFGLVHGVGFADILMGMDLPKSKMAVSLISFNLGIETIQLILMALVVPLLKLMQNRVHYPTAIKFASAAVCVMGGIWLIERLFAV